MQGLPIYNTSGLSWPQIQAKSTAVSIRRATIADAATIADMGRRLLPVAHADALPATDMNLYVGQSFNLAQIRSELSDLTARFWLAENSRAAAGMIKMAPAPLPTAGPGQWPVELSRLYLKPNWIGKGVGSALMQQALTQAADAGHDVCWLMVWAGNGRALDFYRRWGFIVTDTVNYPVGHSQLAAYVMTYQLKSFL